MLVLLTKSDTCWIYQMQQLGGFTWISMASKTRFDWCKWQSRTRSTYSCLWMDYLRLEEIGELKLKPPAPDEMLNDDYLRLVLDVLKIINQQRWKRREEKEGKHACGKRWYKCLCCIMNIEKKSSSKNIKMFDKKKDDIKKWCSELLNCFVVPLEEEMDGACCKCTSWGTQEKRIKTNQKIDS